MENQSKKEWRLIAQALSQETNSEKINSLADQLAEALEEQDEMQVQAAPEKK